MQNVLNIFTREAADSNGTTEFLLASDLPYFSFSFNKGPTTPMLLTLFAIGTLYYFAQSIENKRSLAMSATSIALLLLFQGIIPVYFSDRMATLAAWGFFTLGLAPLVAACVGLSTGWYLVTAGTTMLASTLVLNVLDHSHLVELESNLFEVLRQAGMPG